MGALRDLLGRARGQVKADLAADRKLRYILLLSAALSLFWIWHRVPNFATRDERWRVVDPLEVLGFYLDDPSVQGLRDGLSHWRAYGPTMYLYGLTALPVIALTVVSGDLGIFANIRAAATKDLFAHWHALPGWVWTGTIVLARLTTVVLAVGCVYLVYRIGTQLRDRATGRLAALLLALTWALVSLTHEAGEDVPMLFCLLLVLYLSLRFLETGDGDLVVAGAGLTGLAMAFKLTAGIGVIFFGVAYLLRARRSADFWDSVYRPTVIKRSVVLGLLVFFLSFPSVFAEGPMVVLERIGRGVSAKSSPHGWLYDHPSWWWITRSYLNGLGWPLFVGVLGGLAATLGRLRERSRETDGVIVILSGLVVALGVFSLWAYLRTHHLMPTIPLLVLLLAIALRRLAERRKRLARVLVVGLVVSTAIYTGIGTVGYASQPRDQAVSYISSNAGPNATVETYPWDPQEAAVPHGLETYRWSNRTDTSQSIGDWMGDLPERCPDFIALNHQQAMLYLASENHSALSASYTDPTVEAYLRDLLYTDTYPYEIGGRFGPEPIFLSTGSPRDSTWDLLQAGVNPRSIQYGDPQDFGVDQYVIVLERTGNCTVGSLSDP
ncbi:glycosyltransferase family 39 protein [Halorhabdus salina]|uniref:glycosyltransferase family 39 protein n=1 Tax=Halorhabdus salina TaxID=2750670 RepID=UPI0015EE41C7|nr:glycosyltransferase family 39 protein [Halorhabdus salina]